MKECVDVMYFFRCSHFKTAWMDFFEEMMFFLRKKDMFSEGWLFNEWIENENIFFEELLPKNQW